MRLGGVRGEATVMFSDLRGFTSFAETLEPEQVIAALNRYLTEMSDAILGHGGTLVAYMGDGIMAVFGAPLKQEDHADRALGRGARHARAGWRGSTRSLRDEGLHDGFKMGIGLNSGPVMSGNVGSERRLEYTALGDTTNTAARLEGMTKGTPHQLLRRRQHAAMRCTRPADDLVDGRRVRGPRPQGDDQALVARRAATTARDGPHTGEGAGMTGRCSSVQVRALAPGSEGPNTVANDSPGTRTGRSDRRSLMAEKRTLKTASTTWRGRIESHETFSHDSHRQPGIRLGADRQPEDRAEVPVQGLPAARRPRTSSRP